MRQPWQWIWISIRRSPLPIGGLIVAMLAARTSAQLGNNTVRALEQVPGNSQVELALSAGNSGGESAKSEVIVVVMPYRSKQKSGK